MRDTWKLAVFQSKKEWDDKYDVMKRGKKIEHPFSHLSCPQMLFAGMNLGVWWWTNNERRFLMLPDLSDNKKGGAVVGKAIKDT